VNLAIMYRRNRRRPGLLLATASPKRRTLSVDDWLEQAGTGEAADGETAGDPPQGAAHDATVPPASNGEGEALPKETDGRTPSAE